MSLTKITNSVSKLPNDNLIINGGFDIWQRGTSQTTISYGSADRWIMFHSGTTQTRTRQTFTLGQTDVPGNPTYYMRHVVTSSAGASNYAQLAQRIEGVGTISGENVTISFWAKADAAKTIAVSFDQVFGTGGSPSATVNGSGSKVTLSTSWALYSVTIVIPSVSGKTLGSSGDDFLQVAIWMDAGSTYNLRTDTLGQQSGTFDFSNFKIERGEIATPFVSRPIAEELDICQRYYEVLPFQGNPLVSYTNQYGYCQFDFKVTKRATPTRTLSGFQFYLNSVGWYSPNGSVTFGGGVDSSLVSVVDTRLVSGVSYITTGWVYSDAEL